MARHKRGSAALPAPPSLMMLIRDPVHGLVAFEGRHASLMDQLLPCTEVQRLRRIRQLGLASLVFPGAEHSRFAHALGTAHVMQRLQHRLTALASSLPAAARLDADSAEESLAAALLHDLGHGPFSHLFEEVLPGALHHEDWTQAVLLAQDSEVHRALETRTTGLAARVAALLRGEHRLSYLPATLSGTLDVDRADYLLRDSHMSGVRYGLYDLDWLLQAQTVVQVPRASGPDIFCLAVEGRKGLPPIESFFLGRHFMYQQVYHHKAVRAAETLVRWLFRRLRCLVQDGQAPAGLPAALNAACRGQQPSVADYIALDDATLLAAVAAWQDARDPLLRNLAHRLRRRVLPKTAPLPAGEDARPLWQKLHAALRDIAHQQGLDPDYNVALDVPRDVPYREGAGEDASPLWVCLRHQPPQALSEASFLLQQLRDKAIERPRLIFAPALRPAVERLLEGSLSARAFDSQ